MPVTDRRRFATLTLAALGIVYGDIGTSPLYSLKEVFAGAHHPVPVSPDNVLGILSLFFWSLIMVVTVKYVAFMMRADNRGEGGIIALLTLALGERTGAGRRNRILITLGLCGAALFYGDGVITPAISVLSAVEGLEIIAPGFEPWVVPITLVVLFGLFLLQRRGTAMVGALFGPIMVIWFVVLALLGVMAIVRNPGVMAALSPWPGLHFLLTHPGLGFFSLGAVVLCITGAEALYADMGHFGARPIQFAWLGLVLPALVLNYFGQGAVLLTDPASVENPFYLMAPAWARYPLVILATLATVVASQAVISGAFSLTRQAMQLGYAPRMDVQHTSDKEMGQIYLPFVNWLLLALIVLLVLTFKTSGALAAAYGIAVTGTMLVTNVLAAAVAIRRWHWSPARALLGALPFMLIDTAFFSANLVKIPEGGWLPLAFGLLVYLLLSTWRRGRELLRQRLLDGSLRLEHLLADVEQGHVTRVAGSAVFLTSDPELVPHAMLHSLKHYQVLHEQVIILNVQVEGVPYVPASERLVLTPREAGFVQLVVHYGFKDEPDIPAAIAQAAQSGLKLAGELSYFVGRETLVPAVSPGLPRWRSGLFAVLFRNAGSATAYFRIPANRTIELGARIVL